MEQSPKPSQLLESYINNGWRYSPEGADKEISRTQLNSMIHGRMTVTDTAEWDEEMHPQVDRLKVGETTVLTSGAWEYIKVTKKSSNTFDAEYGTYEDADMPPATSSVVEKYINDKDARYKEIKRIQNLREKATPSELTKLKMLVNLMKKELGHGAPDDPERLPK